MIAPLFKESDSDYCFIKVDFNEYSESDIIHTLNKHAKRDSKSILNIDGVSKWTSKNKKFDISYLSEIKEILISVRYDGKTQ